MMAQPLFAEIIASTDKVTHAVAWVFSKPVLRKFTGEGHQKRAGEWVCNWQKHFDHEWVYIKDAFSKTMDEFVSALSLYGVDSVIIGKALQSFQGTDILHG